MLENTLSKITYFLIHLILMGIMVCFVIFGSKSVQWFFTIFGIIEIIYGLFLFANNVFFHSEFLGEFMGYSVSYEETNLYEHLGSLIGSIILGIIIIRLPKNLEFNGFFTLLLIFVFASIIGIKNLKENRLCDHNNNLVRTLGEFVPLVYMISGMIILLFIKFSIPLAAQIVVIALACAFDLFRVIRVFIEEINW